MDKPILLNGGICDCGHLPTARPKGQTSGGTGYGTYDGKTYCYACCAERDRADMIATGRATLYLVRKKSSDGKEFDIFTRHVTNWPGTLEFRCSETRHYPRSGGFGSQRTDAWFAGPDGYVWHAVNRGDMDIARCKRTKVKA